MFYSRPAGELSRKVHLNGQALGSPVFSWLSMKVSGVALLDFAVSPDQRIGKSILSS